MNIDLSFLPKAVIGTSVPRATSGTLSGHAAGEPFDKHVFGILKKHYPNETYRQYEYLNKLYTENPDATLFKDRSALIVSPVLGYLLNRGKAAIQGWNAAALFEEKQNDTSDIIVVKDGFFHLIDVKTYNVAKKGQPANIISALKVANMCAGMLSTKIFDTHSIIYIGVTWRLDKETLVCDGLEIRELFKTKPSNLYINWAAAMQIQFHVHELDQSYDGTVQEWCEGYLEKFTRGAKARSEKMINDYVLPFQRYLKQ